MIQINILQVQSSKIFCKREKNEIRKIHKTDLMRKSEEKKCVPQKRSFNRNSTNKKMLHFFQPKTKTNKKYK